MKRIFLAITVISLSCSAYAHRGGLDAKGGHTNHKTGEYHCHSAKCGAQPNTDSRHVPKPQKQSFTKYNRKAWRHWSDVDGDCMNTRHETLLAQADGQAKLSPDGCYVSAAVWHDPYSGKTFTRASDLDIDHVVPLFWAHKHGGSQWSARKKEQFANDPINLLAVDDGLNQAKRAKGTDEWMPPNHAYRCEYLEHWQKVLNKYPSLKMTSRAQRIFNKQSKACQ